MSLASNIHELLMGGSTGTYSYTINNSLRFRSSASAYLSRTPASAGNRQTWTWSGWVKRGAISQTAYRSLFGGGETAVTFYDDSTYTSQIIVNLRTSGTNVFLNYAPVFRDTSAWYHFVFACDTTQSTSSNRFKFYINGVQITSAGSLGLNYPTQNWSTDINSTSLQTIGVDAIISNSFDGYMSEINLVDGLALDPSYFGATNSTTGTWSPKAYTGSYGTNGFYLPFSDTSGLTSGSNTGIGKDFSGNGKYWNTNNISLTAGSTYDAMLDSPTPKSSTVGNYAVLNPLNSASTSIISGNLEISQSSSWATGLSTIRMTSGKWYFEVRCGVTALGSSGCTIGIANQNYAVSGNLTGSNSCGYYSNDGTVYNNGSAGTVLGTYTNGDVIGVAFDVDSGKIWFAKNGTWLASGNPATGANPVVTGLSASSWAFGVASYLNTNIVNFGQRPFAYTLPTGYSRLQTYNLPTPAIKKGNQHFDATTYTGTSASQSIVNSGAFQPGFVWAKQRGAATDHVLYDAIRGGSLSMTSNSTAAETNQTSNGCTVAFISNGFTAGADTFGVLNYSARTYVAWQWKANGAPVSNNAGSIASQVSANQSAGFSVVTYTGTGVAGTIGHGLGVAPSMIIIKRRDAVGGWPVYHAAFGNTGAGYLNGTGAWDAPTSAYWNNTTPSSSVVTVNNNAVNNASGGTFVAYCFAAIAGYSAFGSYTGNGSADGTFIYTGFRPRYIMLKSSSDITSWWCYDSSRNTYNAVDLGLVPNATNVDTSGYPLDFLSNGFKLRNSNGDFNGSARTYIYAAFAENPFQYSLAR